jgi:hypothetical protein
MKFLCTRKDFFSSSPRRETVTATRGCGSLWNSQQILKSLGRWVEHHSWGGLFLTSATSHSNAQGSSVERFDERSRGIGGASQVSANVRRGHDGWLRGGRLYIGSKTASAVGCQAFAACQWRKCSCLGVSAKRLATARREGRVTRSLARSADCR